MDQSNSTLFYYNITNLLPGTYSYKIYGNDSVNTFGISSERTFTVNNAMISVIINTPTNGSFIGVGSQQSTTTLDGPSSIDTVLFQFSNNSNSFSLSGNNTEEIWQTTFDSELLAEGLQTLTIFANDSLSNLNDTESVTFTVDKTTPSLFSIEVPEEVYSNDSITFFLNATDANLNIEIILESDFSGVWVNYTMILETGDQFTYTIPSNLTTPGVIQSRFYVFDLAGNKNSSDTLSVNVLNRLPSASITNPINETTLEVGTSIQFNGAGNNVDNDPLTYTWNFADGSTDSGISIVHSYISTGTFTTLLNVSDSYNETFTSTDVIVEDTRAPNLTSVTYDSEVHLEEDGSQLVSVVTSDYSGISTVTLEASLTPYAADCNPTETSWACSWTLDNLSIGSTSFTVSARDNYTTTHLGTYTYDFTVTSCSDGVQNGDENGIDCDGSCDDSCPESSSGSSSSSSSSGGGSGGSSSGSSTTNNNEITTAAITETEISESNVEVIPEEEVVEITTEEPVEESIGIDNSLGQRITGGVSAFVTGKVGKKWYGFSALIFIILFLSVTIYYVVKSKNNKPVMVTKIKNN